MPAFLQAFQKYAVEKRNRRAISRRNSLCIYSATPSHRFNRRNRTEPRTLSPTQILTPGPDDGGKHGLARKSCAEKMRLWHRGADLRKLPRFHHAQIFILQNLEHAIVRFTVFDVRVCHSGLLIGEMPTKLHEDLPALSTDTILKAARVREPSTCPTARILCSHFYRPFVIQREGWKKFACYPIRTLCSPDYPFFAGPG